MLPHLHVTCRNNTYVAAVKQIKTTSLPQGHSVMSFGDIRIGCLFDTVPVSFVIREQNTFTGTEIGNYAAFTKKANIIMFSYFSSFFLSTSRLIS